MKDVWRSGRIFQYFPNWFIHRAATKTTHPTEDIENVSYDEIVLVPLAVHRKLDHVCEDEAETDDLHHDAAGEEASHRMALPAHGVHLQRDENGVDEDEDEVQLERVLLVVGEVELQGDEGGLIRIAVDQPEIVEYVRHRVRGHVEATRIEVVPLACGRVPVARYERHVPESAKDLLEGNHFI